MSLSHSEASGCICMSCGTKWDFKPGVNYSGFKTVRREYEKKDGTVNAEDLVALLCKKCADKLSCEGQESFA